MCAFYISSSQTWSQNPFAPLKFIEGPQIFLCGMLLSDLECLKQRLRNFINTSLFKTVINSLHMNISNISMKNNYFSKVKKQWSVLHFASFFMSGLIKGHWISNLPLHLVIVMSHSCASCHIPSWWNKSEKNVSVIMKIVLTSQNSFLKVSEAHGELYKIILLIFKLCVICVVLYISLWNLLYSFYMVF